MVPLFKEGGVRVELRPRVPDVEVIVGVGAQEFFIGFEERCRVLTPRIPDEHEPTLRLEYASKFLAGLLYVEPMKSLARRHYVRAVGGQCGVFGGGGDANELRVVK